MANLKTVKDTIKDSLASFSTELSYAAANVQEVLKVDLKKGLNFVSKNPDQLTIEAKEEGKVEFGLNTAKNSQDLSESNKLATAGAVKDYVDQKVGLLSPTIAYKAGETGEVKKVALTDGLTFKSEAGLPVKVTAEDNGVINVNVDVASAVDGADEGKKLVTADVAKKFVEGKLGESALTFAGDEGETTVKLNKKVTIKGGADQAQLTDNNIGVVAGEPGTLNVKLAKDLKNLASVSVGADNGDRTVVSQDGIKIFNDGGNGPSLTKNGLDNGGKVLSNIADGTRSNDAATVKQVNDVRDANKEAAKSIADALGLTANQPEGTKPAYEKPTFETVVNGAAPNGSAPTTFKDAVNQLTSAVNAGLTFAADQGSIKRNLGQTITFTSSNDKNLTVTAADDKIKFELSKTPTFDKVTLGDQTNTAPTGNEAVSSSYFDKKLEEVNNTVTGNAKLKVANNGQNEKSLALSSQSLDFKNGNNTTVKVGDIGTNNKLPISVDINSDLTGITSITAGNGTGNDGAKITLSSGPEKTVSLNGAKLKDLESGKVGAGSKDAVTGDQLNTALQAVKDVLGDSATLTDGTLSKTPGKQSVSEVLDSKLSSITVAAQSGTEATLNPANSKLTINGQKD